MSYRPVLILIIESGGGGGGGGGVLILTIESGGGGGVGIFCPMVRLSHEEFSLVPERTSGMKNENKGLRITYFINFLASSLIIQISYEAL